MRITRFRSLFLALLLLFPASSLMLANARTVEILLSSSSTEQQEEETHQHSARPDRPARGRSRQTRLATLDSSTALSRGTSCQKCGDRPGAVPAGHRLANGHLAPLLT
ncbi:hypothetical protein Mal4_04320 [Maioricimonas rarisocia]|uniref:Secreted protein n=1 Tax=Maioricimonas rarisocia TaxID=2528026 RepID=A0A517Z156_9PLAN|nr:hypothetical protein [Maioricimonas rarisocia]QDU36149.1 hypothetical protein Mal4_04320 [Maioricimonas rarisocia]